MRGINLLSGHPSAYRFANTLLASTIDHPPLLSVMRRIQRYSNPYTTVFPVKIIRGLHHNLLSRRGLTSKEERCGHRIEAYPFWYVPYPARYRHGRNTADGSCGKLKMEPGLLVEMFHRSSTEQDKDADPECGSLKGDCLIGLPSLFFCIIGLE